MKKPTKKQQKARDEFFGSFFRSKIPKEELEKFKKAWNKGIDKSTSFRMPIFKDKK